MVGMEKKHTIFLVPVFFLSIMTTTVMKGGGAVAKEMHSDTVINILTNYLDRHYTIAVFSFERQDCALVLVCMY